MATQEVLDLLTKAHHTLTKEAFVQGEWIAPLQYEPFTIGRVPLSAGCGVCTIGALGKNTVWSGKKWEEEDQCYSYELSLSGLAADEVAIQAIDELIRTIYALYPEQDESIEDVLSWSGTDRLDFVSDWSEEDDRTRSEALALYRKTIKRVTRELERERELVPA